ncbi:MAG: hypothetical protein B5M48_01535 [Candidatus Omnitrophica bacterium 4484_213]|nr:MAG: hypothetical protein B5M48_01535 [Candidatus Omnitrophica bacterium 4484_213]
MKPERALTLVELLIAGAIVGVVFLGIITVFLAGQKSFTDTSMQILAQHKVNLAIVEGVREVSRTGPKERGIDISATFGALPSDGDIASSGLFADYIDLDESGLGDDDK